MYVSMLFIYFLHNHYEPFRLRYYSFCNSFLLIVSGRFLADVFESLDAIGCSRQLRTNHRAESQRIIDNAGLILERKMPVIEPERQFHEIRMDDALTGGAAVDHGLLSNQNPFT